MTRAGGTGLACLAAFVAGCGGAIETFQDPDAPRGVTVDAPRGVTVDAPRGVTVDAPNVTRTDAPPVTVDAPNVTRADAPPVTGAPRLGAHNLVFHRPNGNVANINSAGLTTTPGSAIFVLEGRGDIGQFSLPTDNKGNSPYVQLGDTHAYVPSFPNSGTGSYAFLDATGGADHVVTAGTPASDEITMVVVEVVNGRRIQDVQWIEVVAPGTLRSAQVTTTGPATLIAVWWGDADVQPSDQTAVPGDGFTVIESVLFSGALVQCAVATKDVAAAGSYDVTWSATPIQGAQMWLVAVQ